MVVLSQSALNHSLNHVALITTCKQLTPTSTATLSFNGIPAIDLSEPGAEARVVAACGEFGFFKVVNHGVPLEIINRLEDEATKFFNLSQAEKDKAGPPDPFGYGNKRIGSNGDVGWIEYLLFTTNPEAISKKALFFAQGNRETFRSAVDEYLKAVKELACQVVEMIADGLGIKPRNVLSKMLRDEYSDSCFRLNHYPPCPELQALSGRNLIGFGEHTDPQIISVLRSNNTSGLQICLRDGTWVSVPSDRSSFFINVGDSLQVLTNGRMRSVKHRVLTDHTKSRLSMIYFGGPPLKEKIAPLQALLGQEVSLYKEFTWSEYKTSAYKSRLADYRLGSFEKANI